MPWLEDIATVLEANGIASRAAGTLFLTEEAAVPSIPSGGVLFVTETGGSAPENTQNSVLTPAYLRPNAQILARGSSYPICRALSESAYLALFAIRNQFVNSGWYRKIRPLQEPTDLGFDPKKGRQVVFNVQGETSQGRMLS